MPFIDVTDILSDPEIAGDAFQVERAVRSMTQRGRVVDTPALFDAIGNVQPADTGELLQLPEEDRVETSISVTTMFNLRTLTENHAPDVVLWNGQRWRVVKIDPWQNYGAGFTKAICQLTSMTLNEISQLRPDNP